MRLAEEYDAAQDRGEIGRHGGARGEQVSQGETCRATDVMNPRELHEARQMRDAERESPGPAHVTTAG